MFTVCDYSDNDETHLTFYRSPDLNSLDLGAWYSLAAGVPSLKAVPGQKARTID